MNAADQACFEQATQQIKKEQFNAMLSALVKQGIEERLLWMPQEPRIFGPTARRIATLMFIVCALGAGYLSHVVQAGLLFLFGLFWLLAGRAANRKYQMLCLSLGLEP